MPFSTLSGSIEEFAPLEVQRVQNQNQRDLFKELLGRYHYLGYAMPFGARIQYLIHVTRPKREVVGCIQFSSPAWRMKARDKWIGWDDKRRGEALQQVVNNSRFLVLADIRNLASSMLAACLKRLRGDWEEQYGVSPASCGDSGGPEAILWRGVTGQPTGLNWERPRGEGEWTGPINVMEPR